VARVLTRLLIVLFALLRAPLVVAPPTVFTEPQLRLHPNEKPNLPGWWR
jgi:hypothetical protein